MSVTSMGREQRLPAAAAVLGIVATAVIGCGGAEVGNKYFWQTNRSYHFKTLAALGRVSAGAAQPNEVLNIIRRIDGSDIESWYENWLEAAQRNEALAATYGDAMNRARAMRRAVTYYQNAEFYLPGDDPRRTETWERQIALFYQALALEGIRVDRLKVPYGEHRLRANYFPGLEGHQKAKPLILIMSGLDGTIEGTFFTEIEPLLQRGYSVLVFEGPGQGEAIRKEGLPFIHEWEKPTSAVLDHFEESYGAPEKVVFIGISFGGLLGMRATAFEDRIDGFVAFDAFYDVGQIQRAQSPSIVSNLVAWGLEPLANWLLETAVEDDVGTKWLLDHTMWVIGGDTPLEAAGRFGEYSVRDSVDKVTADVLLLLGEADHYYATTDQIGTLQRELVNARSVTSIVFKAGEPGEEHCRVGARALNNEAIVEWIEKTFVSG